MASDQTFNSENSEPYKYSPLNEEAQEIRLLTLLPDTLASDVRLSLDITPFTEYHVPKFEAVSYTWGSAENPVNIFIGESGRKTLAVTRNLAEALPYFRYEDKPRILWIDAICVDQKNLKERSQQVKRMADIYSKTIKVLVWLGPESDDSSLALHLFEKIASNVKVDEATRALVATTDDIHWADKDIKLPFNGVELLSTFKLIHRPWFERLWIWQEIHLASGNIEVMCGSRTILWAALRSAVLCLHMKQIPMFNQEEEASKPKQLDAVWSLCFGLSSNSIDELLDETKHCVCSDPRDKIYALLSLLYGAPRFEIEPDYAKSVNETYQHATLSIIKSTKRLQVLATGESQEHLERCPSWVPNRKLLTPAQWIAPRLCNRFPSSSASSETNHTLPANLQGSILKVEGTAVAVVWEVEPMLSFSNPKASTKDRIKELMTISTLAGFRGASFQSHQHKAFTRAICCNCFSEQYSPAPTYYPTLARSEEAVHRILTSDIDNELGWNQPDFTSILNYVRFACAGRSFYMTQDGICGLAPLHAKKGDVVTVLLGCNSPMVLRPTTEGTYKLVGEAYCDGFMHAEALLGALPDPFEFIMRYDNNSGYWQWAFQNKKTGRFQVGDPRLGPLPPGWELRSHTKEEFWQLFKNHKTGEETWWDPRLTSEELRKRGVALLVFDLV
ncbi:uncharacterized protein PAC_16820 [Phialocephala subalpina]|uniref:WW domain-containing protein n=1 Tax=Phialocephala subalpina TaxID=576137 RepID=A0A1L7XPF9_9HELO|nr:uncharacterized protein PAC_16820 [Phialocephala subalpina]